MKKINYVLISYLLIVFSCQKTAENESLTYDCKLEQQYKELTNSIIRSIKIDNDSLIGLYSKISVISSEDGEFLYGINFGLNRIEKFNLTNETYIKTIYTNTPVELRQLPLSEAKFINQDSIILFGSGGRMVIMNEAEKVVDKWDFSKLISPNSDLSGVDPLNNSESFFFYKNKIYVRSFPPLNWDKDVEFYEKPFMLEFDPVNLKVTKLLGMFPELMTADPNNYFYNDYKFSWTKFKNNPGELIISYRRAHCLQILDLSSSNSTFVSAKSKFLNDFELIPREYNSQAGRNILVSQGIYHNLIFDSYRKLYYRIVSHSQPLRNSTTNRINSAAIKPFSIIVLDDKLNYLGESTISNYQNYSYLNPAVSSEGIVFPVYDNDENIVSFDIIKINYEE
ncbi:MULTISPECIES: DUF4221 family protein [Roseivirga]|nr:MULTISPECIES: DUF4221 family protein [Roseivirga]MBO6662289.1 DUF4221 family protein [Roseivirga sp.]MBO6910205.1 DUF4221 family protein [Roseivirga sp.]WPZ08862.1 DUF4221 family protein [Roseivirga spongicola]